MLRDFIEDGINLLLVTAAVGVVVHVALLFGSDGVSASSACSSHFGLSEVFNPFADAVNELRRPGTDVGAASLHPTIQKAKQDASDVADLASGIAAIETGEHRECQDDESQPLHLEPYHTDKEVEPNGLLRLTHGDGNNQRTDGARCPNDVREETIELEIGEDVVAKQEKYPSKDAAGEIERQQLTAGVMLKEELAEPPQPKHIENEVERVLSEVSVAEHVGEQRPGMHQEIVQVGRQGQPVRPGDAGPDEEHADELPELCEQEDSDSDVDEFAVDGESLVFDHKSECHAFVMFP